MSRDPFGQKFFMAVSDKSMISVLIDQGKSKKIAEGK